MFSISACRNNPELKSVCDDAKKCTFSNRFECFSHFSSVLHTQPRPCMPSPVYPNCRPAGAPLHAFSTLGATIPLKCSLRVTLYVQGKNHLGTNRFRSAAVLLVPEYVAALTATVLHRFFWRLTQQHNVAINVWNVWLVTKKCNGSLLHPNGFSI